MIYLDNAATTKVAEAVLMEMLPYFTVAYGNAGSVHSLGREAQTALKAARRQVAIPISANPEEIIFTSGGSEANSLTVLGIAEYLKKFGKTHIITTPVEHHSVLSGMTYLSNHGFRITYLPIDSNGSIKISDLANMIQHDTGMISVMCVNNETGNLYPISQIGQVCKSKNILFHTDCVQAYCETDINVKKDNIDFLSVSGHKIGAPKGIGFLYAKNKNLLQPAILGGGQEFGLRSGTENISGIVGLAKGAELAYQRLQEKRLPYQDMRIKFLTLLQRKMTNFSVNGNPYEDSKILNLSFPGVDGETLVLLLDGMGVLVSAGAACAAHSAKPSHVLLALGLTEEQARSSIRISFSREITEEEIVFACNAITEAVQCLRSPLAESYI